ncbi:hypothetical protein EVAR_9837_1 [Eumeta japonica]|uniref:Uncharacterized protein n=1 Tax=Eumeta variegata TaxID=151549 RepID=A0A4C1TQ61_EUMVA|nr:hypothetical protein EVAR_9837_1 [Eumeta japonica]
MLILSLQHRAPLCLNLAATSLYGSRGGSESGLKKIRIGIEKEPKLESKKNQNWSRKRTKTGIEKEPELESKKNQNWKRKRIRIGLEKEPESE